MEVLQQEHRQERHPYGADDRGAGRRAGEVILAAEGVSLAFGGVKALSDISFDVREHEIRAIIGSAARSALTFSTHSRISASVWGLLARSV